MKRRQALQTITGGVAGLAVLPLVARANYEFEFMRAGWDTEGNYFPLGECVDAMNAARLPIPVYDDADWGRNVASHIVSLRMDGDRMLATVDRLPADPEMDLAMSGILLTPCTGARINAFEFDGGLWTLSKVQHCGPPVFPDVEHEIMQALAMDMSDLVDRAFMAGL